MAKNLKLNIKNEQLAQAINLNGLKSKIAKGKESVKDEAAKTKASSKSAATPPTSSEPAREIKEDAPKIKARSKSAFAEGTSPAGHPSPSKPATPVAQPSPTEPSPIFEGSPEEISAIKPKSNAELRKQIFGDIDEAELKSAIPEPMPEPLPKPTPPLRTVEPTHEVTHAKHASSSQQEPSTDKEKLSSERETHTPPHREQHHREQPRERHQEAPRTHPPREYQPRTQAPREHAPRDSQRSYPASNYQGRPPRDHGNQRENYPPREHREHRGEQRSDHRDDQGSRRDSPQRPYRHPQGSPFAQPQNQGPYSHPPRAPYEKLGPTGKHINDLIPQKPRRPDGDRSRAGGPPPRGGSPFPRQPLQAPLEPPNKDKERRRTPVPKEASTSFDEDAKKGIKTGKAKEFRDVKPKKTDTGKNFDARDRHGLRADDESQGWRKKRPKMAKKTVEETTIRPTHLSIRIPILVKDLASEMKLKASQLIAKLFMQGIAVTLNDVLDDETTIQLLGQEFGCEITIDTKEEDRIRITDKTIKEEINESNPEDLITRAPIVAFMGHVDHGKTSLIDAIRSSNRVSGEAGAITQHIGAFRCSTAVGDITILDTPGHEAFSAMRARGADVTDIVVLVVAGDEGIRQQTIEAINHAKTAGNTIVVAINKSDKPNFNPEVVYRQLADQELLPESWGGQTITVNCSAVTKEGINTLLEMLAIQAEVLELKANPKSRARGTVLESELHKGMGSVATILVQNGTLNRGDALVFSQHWGRVKTMQNEHGKDQAHAGPSTPVEITGLSGLPSAGEEFIVVKSEKEAREIAEVRATDVYQKRLQQGRKLSMESLFQQAKEDSKKVLNVILRADVQGSLEAVKTALEKIHSDKVILNVISADVGEISESDAQLAETSKAVIIGFHTQIEAHSESLLKELGIKAFLHDVIYHAVDQAKELMAGLLDKIPEEKEKGVVEVKAVFKSSQYGNIAGCQVTEGSIHRNNLVRVRRGKDVIWKGSISSLKRIKEDVREVQKGFECGIVLNGFNDVLPSDIIEAYEITYRTQEL